MDGASNVNMENWESNNYQIENEVNVETSYSPLKDPAIIHANESVAPVRFPLDGQSTTGDHHTGYPIEPVVTEGYSTSFTHHYQSGPILNEPYDNSLPLGHYAHGAEANSTGYDHNLMVEHYPNNAAISHETEYQQSIPVQHYANNGTNLHQLDYTIDQGIPVNQHYAVIEADGNVQLTDNNYTLNTDHLTSHHVNNTIEQEIIHEVDTSVRENPTLVQEVPTPVEEVHATVQEVPTPVQEVHTTIHEVNASISTSKLSIIVDQVAVNTEVVSETIEVPPIVQQPELPPNSQDQPSKPPVDKPALPLTNIVLENNNTVVEEKSIDQVLVTPAPSVLNKSENVIIYESVDNVSIDYSAAVTAEKGDVESECIDLVLPVIDSSSVTMTDPVSLRPKLVKSAEAARGEPLSQEELPPVLDAAPVRGESVYTLPPHMMGRTVENSGEDIGPHIQKPRFGVKVPCRNLTSQIVTKQELANEVFERAPKYDPPKGGDFLFKKGLTKRLASRVSAGAKAKEESKPKAKQEAPKTDEDDLLAILEGDVDDWTIDQPPPQLIEAAKSPVSNHNDPPKLDRAVEREIALRQLSTMPSPRRRKDLSMKPPPPFRRFKEPAVVEPVPGSSKSIPLRKRKIPEEALAGVGLAESPSNGDTKAIGPAPVDVENKKKIVIKEPRIFKTKRSTPLTNGKTEEKPAVSPKKPKVADDVAKQTERNLISPPRTYSSRIKKSTYNDDFVFDVFPSTSKSRVIPIVAKATVKPPTTKVEATQPAIVTPTSPEKLVVKSPAKKTPVKVKQPVAEKAKVTKTPAKLAKKTPKKLTEIDKLLMDEGAINMLYSVEKDEEQRRTAGSSPVEPGPKKRVLKSARYSQKDLLMKTRMVKNAVQRLKNDPDQDSPTVSLRAKRSSIAVPPAKPPIRKTSLDSSASLDPGSPTQIFTYPPSLRPAAEASRIIRRHSSSSNFSSRSTSPNPGGRPSVDAMSPQAPDHVQAASRKTRKRSNPIYIRKLEATSAAKIKKKKKSGTEDSIFQPEAGQIDKEELKTQMAKNFQQVSPAKASRSKKVSTSDSVPSDVKAAPGSEEVTACLAEAVTAFIAEDGNLDSSSLPPELPRQSIASSSDLATASGFSSLVLRLELDCTRRAERSKERCSLRQAAAALHFTSLRLRHHDHLVQLELAPLDTQLPGALNAQVLHELSDALNHLGKDEACRAVLLTSTGPGFCAGLDLPCLLAEEPEKRRTAAVEMAAALKKFAGSLARFEKPIIAGVQGSAVGVGVTMLAHFDLVYADTDATFHTPYSRLGQLAEAAAVVALPQVVGRHAASEMLLAGRKFTAHEAHSCGLVTRVLDSDDFLDTLLPLARSVATQSLQSMEATKALLRYSSCSSVEASLEAESRLLVQHWTSAECQANIRRYLDDQAKLQ